MKRSYYHCREDYVNYVEQLALATFAPFKNAIVEVKDMSYAIYITLQNTTSPTENQFKVEVRANEKGPKEKEPNIVKTGDDVRTFGIVLGPPTYFRVSSYGRGDFFEEWSLLEAFVALYRQLLKEEVGYPKVYLTAQDIINKAKSKVHEGANEFLYPLLAPYVGCEKGTVVNLPAFNLPEVLKAKGYSMEFRMLEEFGGKSRKAPPRFHVTFKKDGTIAKRR